MVVTLIWIYILWIKIVSTFAYIVIFFISDKVFHYKPVHWKLDCYKKNLWSQTPSSRQVFSILTTDKNNLEGKIWLNSLVY